MKVDSGYQTYLARLEAAAALPQVYASEAEMIERRSRAEVDALDRTRREAAQRWVGMRDNSARLARKVDELADRVGVPRSAAPIAAPLPASALPGALEALRLNLEQADQAWQWVLRHRERRTIAPPVPLTPPPPTPAAVYTPPPLPPATSGRSWVNTNALLVIAVVVIIVLVIVVIVMAG